MGLDSIWVRPKFDDVEAEQAVALLRAVRDTKFNLSPDDMKAVDRACDALTEHETKYVEPTFDPPLNLCGGIFSDNGSGSFRGKVYEGVIQEVTNGEVSLYVEQMPNADVRKISDAFNAVSWIQPICTRHELSTEGYLDLQRMFQAYADAGYCLAGWW